MPARRRLSGPRASGGGTRTLEDVRQERGVSTPQSGGGGGGNGGVSSEVQRGDLVQPDSGQAYYVGSITDPNRRRMEEAQGQQIARQTARNLGYEPSGTGDEGQTLYTQLTAEERTGLSPAPGTERNFLGQFRQMVTPGVPTEPVQNRALIERYRPEILNRPSVSRESKGITFSSIYAGEQPQLRQSRGGTPNLTQLFQTPPTQKKRKGEVGFFDILPSVSGAELKGTQTRSPNAPPSLFLIGEQIQKEKQKNQLGVVPIIPGLLYGSPKRKEQIINLLETGIKKLKVYEEETTQIPAFVVEGATKDITAITPRGLLATPARITLQTAEFTIKNPLAATVTVIAAATIPVALAAELSPVLGVGLSRSIVSGITTFGFPALSAVQAPQGKKGREFIGALVAQEALIGITKGVIKSSEFFPVKTKVLDVSTISVQEITPEGLVRQSSKPTFKIQSGNRQFEIIGKTESIGVPGIKNQLNIRQIGRFELKETGSSKKPSIIDLQFKGITKGTSTDKFLTGGITEELITTPEQKVYAKGGIAKFVSQKYFSEGDFSRYINLGSQATTKEVLIPSGINPQEFRFVATKFKPSIIFGGITREVARVKFERQLEQTIFESRDVGRFGSFVSKELKSKGGKIISEVPQKVFPKSKKGQLSLSSQLELIQEPRLKTRVKSISEIESLGLESGRQRIKSILKEERRGRLKEIDIRIGEIVRPSLLSLGIVKSIQGIKLDTFEIPKLKQISIPKITTIQIPKLQSLQIQQYSITPPKFSVPNLRLTAIQLPIFGIPKLPNITGVPFTPPPIVPFFGLPDLGGSGFGGRKGRSLAYRRAQYQPSFFAAGEKKYVKRSAKSLNNQLLTGLEIREVPI